MPREQLIAKIREHAATLRYPSDQSILDDMRHLLGRPVTNWDEVSDAELQKVLDRIDASVASGAHLARGSQ